MIASAAFIIRTCLELVLYIVLLCGRDPSGRQQLVLSKKNFGVPKGVSVETVETPLDPPLENHKVKRRRAWDSAV